MADLEVSHQVLAAEEVNAKLTRRAKIDEGRAAITTNSRLAPIGISDSLLSPCYTKQNRDRLHGQRALVYCRRGPPPRGERRVDEAAEGEDPDARRRDAPPAAAARPMRPALQFTRPGYQAGRIVNPA